MCQNAIMHSPLEQLGNPEALVHGATLKTGKPDMTQKLINVTCIGFQRLWETSCLENRPQTFCYHQAKKIKQYFLQKK
jgi:hypothetical protein